MNKLKKSHMDKMGTIKQKGRYLLKQCARWKNIWEKKQGKELPYLSLMLSEMNNTILDVQYPMDCD